MKLCDFDSARDIGDSFPYQVDSDSGVKVLKFTRLWVSPEVYHFNREWLKKISEDTCRSEMTPILPVTPSMDIFCVGLVLICLFSPERERGVSMTVLPDTSIDQSDINSNKSNIAAKDVNEYERDLLNSLTNSSYLTNKICSLPVDYHQPLLSLCCLDSSSRGSLSNVFSTFESMNLRRDISSNCASRRNC